MSAVSLDGAHFAHYIYDSLMTHKCRFYYKSIVAIVYRLDKDFCVFKTLFS